jgi:heptosyltransferase-2
LPRKRALIVKFGQIGDVIMAIPAAHLLHQQGFEITWVCSAAVQPLLACYPWISVISTGKELLFGSPLERLQNIARLWRRLAFEKYDLCATLYYDRRYRLLTVPVQSQRRIAFAQQTRATSMVAGRHHTDEYARLLRGSEDGYRDESCVPIRPEHLPLSPLPEKSAYRRIAIVPGGAAHLVRQQIQGRPAELAVRRWPIENYVLLAQQLLERGWEVVLVGGPEDAWAEAYFQHLRVTDCIGLLSLPEVVSTFDACDGVVSHDTGPLHLAGISTACLVGIFGPTNPATFLPRRPFVLGIWGGEGFACRPCYDGRDFASCQFNGCMQQVTPDRVIKELDQLLQDRSEGRSRPWRIVSPGTGLIAPLVGITNRAELRAHEGLDNDGPIQELQGLEPTI